ncbi:hypothetical protein Mcup_1104 [Metallosphaera cuprina Ar-4]|uniref:Uncharacterized protein n=1 Tax=Metallosphaera cuprina (strain Ar-4) TaxID=1006006 RepID=F4G311_METCR|nr:hypothetical protein Mcup_1104 [Metallosphaera cuprina Ar-4]
MSKTRFKPDVNTPIWGESSGEKFREVNATKRYQNLEKLVKSLVRK